MPDIVIYTQDWCPYCVRAKQIFAKRGAKFTEIDAPNGTPSRAEAQAKSGGRTTVPQIFINGAHIGGCDDLVALDRSGQLDRLLAS